MARNKLHDTPALVIGLGRFGLAAALELQRLGHQVTVIEANRDRAELYASSFPKLVRADAASPDLVERLRANQFQSAVVALGSSVEASALACVNLVDAGVRSIWAKAKSAEHARVLERIGVSHVVRPEADSGRRVAHLVNGKLQDYIEFDDGFAIVKMRPPQEAVGFTLEQSQIRSKYGVTVVGVKVSGEDFTYAVPSTKIRSEDTLIVSGPTKLIERLASRP